MLKVYTETVASVMLTSEKPVEKSEEKRKIIVQIELNLLEKVFGIFSQDTTDT